MGAVVGVGVAVGFAVAVGVGEGVGVAVPPLSVSAVESMKKSVAREPVCFAVQRIVAVLPANDERLTVCAT